MCLLLQPASSAGGDEITIVQKLRVVEGGVMGEQEWPEVDLVRGRGVGVGSVGRRERGGVRC